MLGHILIVENDHNLRVAFRRAFESNDAVVYSATSTAHGLSQLAALGEPRVVVGVEGGFDAMPFLAAGVRVMTYSLTEDFEEFCLRVAQSVSCSRV